MISLTLSNVGFAVGVKSILSDVSFSIEDSDKLGVVGVNGSGKSTLLRLICGEYDATDGAVYIAKNKSVGILYQDDAFKISNEGDNTVLSQMYAAFPQLVRDEESLLRLESEFKLAEGEKLVQLSAEYEKINTRFMDAGGLHYKSRCKSLLSRLGFDESTHQLPIDALSGGQRTRLALARLLYREPDILILDEPTNHLDTETMLWLENHLSSYKKTVILVSHDRYFLDKVTNKTLDIENTHAKLYKCPYSQFTKQKEADRLAQERAYTNQQREIERLERYIEQQRRWNRERNIIAAESRQKAIDRMEKVERPEDAPKGINFSFTGGGETGNDVLSVRELSMAFGDKKLFSNLSFDVKKREKLFIVGANGTGKSTLLKILLGKLRQISGVYEFGYNVKIGYYDQENQNLSPEKTVLDELWDAYPDMTQTKLRSTLALFRFTGDDIEKTVSVLSGGERARLTFAKLMLSETNVLILDEPTNHLDIASREALEDAVNAFDGTVIAVSHDRYFMKRLATRILELGDKVLDYRGTYDEYIMKKEKDAENAEAKAEAPTVSAAPTGKELYLARKEAEAARRKAAARHKKVVEEIEKLEKELADITDKLFGEAATDYVLAAELDDRRITVEDRLMQLYEEEENYNGE
ncbi:MAG: ABC-F family ATP-binding cassette domain-containing protein [Clostridia bacterium]|nr:ABC-F family ATP-binding cassette domain-containing protein [Clostridia bacterium]